jgi:predicted RNA-binding protein with PIN domain
VNRYLVDGNNVMGQRVGWHRDRPGARRRLVQELTALAGAGCEICVVFDPPDDGDLALSERAISVRFAPDGGTADECILELLAAESKPDDWIVVTSDRDLAARAKALGARILASGKFRRMLD